MPVPANRSDFRRGQAHLKEPADRLVAAPTDSSEDATGRQILSRECADEDRKRASLAAIEGRGRHRQSKFSKHRRGRPLPAAPVRARTALGSVTQATCRFHVPKHKGHRKGNVIPNGGPGVLPLGGRSGADWVSVAPNRGGRVESCLRLWITRVRRDTAVCYRDLTQGERMINR
jgi:hypothetical protein